MRKNNLESAISPNKAHKFFNMKYLRKLMRKLWRLLVPVALLLVTNFYVSLDKKINLKKHPYYKGYSASYNDLYSHSGMHAVSNLKIQRKGEVRIELSPTPSGDNVWVVNDDNNASYKIRGEHPILKLHEGTWNYKVECKTKEVLGRGFDIRIQYQENLGNAGHYHVISSSIPVGVYKNYQIEEFVDYKTNRNNTIARDIEEVGKILYNELNVSEGDTTEEKISKIGGFLLENLDNKRGAPSDSMSSLTPFGSYANAINGRSRVWCVNFADIYAFFANSAGIPTRIVTVTGKLGDVILSGHTFNESFIKETGQWAFVDLTSSKLLVKNKSGDFKNTLELFYINQIGGHDSLNALVFKNQRISKVPYSAVNQSEEFYFSRDATFTFKTRKPELKFLPESISKYIRTVLYPDFIYSLHGAANTNYHTRKIVFSINIILLAFIVYAIMDLLKARRSVL